MSDEGNGVRYTTKEAIESLRTAMNERFDNQDAKLGVIAGDVAALKEFRSFVWGAAKIAGILVGIALTVSLGLLSAGVFK